MEKTCSDCDSKFSCDNDITCWCASFPKLTGDKFNEKDCICIQCLLIRYRKKILNI